MLTSLPLRCTALSIALLVLTGIGCDSGPGSSVRDLGTRVVVIGIDGADWDIIDPLIEQGRMPSMARLKSRAAWGLLKTLPDVALSPVIWTSVATGKTADKHGIGWFMVDRPDGTRVPVRSTNRTAMAIWNILADHGRSPGVIGWWATYPAESVGNGFIVSDALGYHGFGSTARRGNDDTRTYPAPLHGEVAPLMPDAGLISHDFAGRFIYLSGEEFSAEKFGPDNTAGQDVANPIHLFQMYAATAQGYTAIAQRMLEQRDTDLFMLYFEQTDSLAHLFMKYAPPRLPWVDEHGFQRYRDVVTEWYVYQDELLGALLERIDRERTAVFVVSDHGFKTGNRRIRSESTVDITRAHLDHEPDGILLAAGPNIRPGPVEPASVLDVTPTLLHYLGFPVPRDMDGVVLEGLFGTDFMEANPVRRIATYEDDRRGRGTASVEVDYDAESARRNIEALRSLGYVSGAGELPGRYRSNEELGGEMSSPEIHNNLGRIYLRKGESEKAREEFEQALVLDPDNSDALLNLAGLVAAEGKTVRAELLIHRALAVNPDSAAALTQFAELKRKSGDLEEAIRLYREALAVDRQPFVYLGMGDALQRAGRPDEALEAFRSVLELEPDSALAHYNLGVTYGGMERFEAALEAYEKALASNPDGPLAAQVLNNLGAMAMDRGDLDTAVTFFERAVTVSPRHLEALYNLSVTRLQQDRADEAVRLLEHAAEQVPSHELVNLRLGQAYLDLGLGEDAYRRFQLVRRLYPGNWEAAIGMALLYARSGQPEEAGKALDEALDLGGDAARERANEFPLLGKLLSEP